MITLEALAELFEAHRTATVTPVQPVRIGDRTVDVDARPVVMGCVNLSRDSTYRESVAPSAASAIRKGRVLAAQGADLVDLGAESSTARAARVDVDGQLATLLPVVEQLSEEGIAVSVESYHPTVVRRCLAAGAVVVNLTGAAHQDEIFDLVAEHRATLVLCRVSGENVREITDVTLDEDPIPGLLDHFSERLDRAVSRGVDQLVIDPGLGFYYGNLVDPATRIEHQARVLLNTNRLRVLGRPICHAMPHAFDLFEDQFRTAEGFFAVLAQLGGTGVFRTHEVPQVLAVLSAMQVLSVDQPVDRRVARPAGQAISPG